MEINNDILKICFDKLNVKYERFIGVHRIESNGIKVRYMDTVQVNASKNHTIFYSVINVKLTDYITESRRFKLIKLIKN